MATYDGAMTSTLEPLAASEVYWLLFEPHPRRRARRVVAAVLDLWCATSGGMLELTSVGDMVVRRRHDGAEELRIYAGPPSVAAPMLHQVTDDLATLSPEEFREAWGIA